jgi:hypothetical protein
LEAAGLGRGIVEGGPYLQDRRAIQSPEASVVLVPWHGHTTLDVLVPENRSVQRDVGAKNRLGESLKQRILDPCSEEGIKLQSLQLSVGLGRSDPASIEHHVFVSSAGRVVLKEHAGVTYLALHQGRRPSGQIVGGIRAENLPQTGIALLCKFCEGTTEV